MVRGRKEKKEGKRFKMKKKWEREWKEGETRDL